MTPYREMTFALDFDRTFTGDIEFWRLFVRLLALRKHKVWVITGRYDTAENRALVPAVIGDSTCALLEGVIFCDHRPKRDIAEANGVKIDIWIDDLPELIGHADQVVFRKLEAAQPVAETLPVLAPAAVDPRVVWRPWRSSP